MAGEHLQMGKELEWIAELALEAACPVMFNLTQTDFAPELRRDLLISESMAARGAKVYGQVAGRAIGLLMGCEPPSRTPSPPPRLLDSLRAPKPSASALATPEVRARLLNESVSGLSPFEQFVTRSFHKMYPVAANVDYEPEKSASLRGSPRLKGVAQRARL